MICLLVGVKFKLLNSFLKCEEIFCATDRYNNSLIVTSSIQCKQIIRKVVLNEKLTNIERPNHVAVAMLCHSGYVEAAMLCCIGYAMSQWLCYVTVVMLQWLCYVTVVMSKWLCYVALAMLCRSSYAMSQ